MLHGGNLRHRLVLSGDSPSLSQSPGWCNEVGKCSSLAVVYPKGYSRASSTVLRTEEFDRWLSKLKDKQGKARILERIRSLQLGHSGDCAALGDKVHELRIHSGPGYRLYFMRDGKATYLLLCGGTKRSQKRDIVRAKGMAKLLR